MIGFLRIWAYHFFEAFFAAAAGYVVLRALMPHGYVFGAPYRMFCYHMTHPFQYIGVVALVYSFIATPVVFRFGKIEGGRRRAAITGIIIASVLVASVPGGVLWVIHDMQAGYFPEGGAFWRRLMWGAQAGPTAGLLVILYSLPYNLIGIVCGYLITRHGFKLASVSIKISPRDSHD